MLRFAGSLYLVFQLGIISTAFAQIGEAYQLEISYSYGSNQLLPSLLANSSLAFDRASQFSDIWITGGFNISDKLSYIGALEITDQPHELILTNYSRPDYPLSTARLQKSALKYSSGNLTAKFGRDDMLSEKMRPAIYSLPSGGDGFSWKYYLNNWSFQHVFQILSAEKAGGQVFRRSISYHSLSKKIDEFTFGVGEYFLLSGEQIGLDLKRLNPFIPYFVNSFDSEADNYPGYVGDTDNSLIKLFWEKRKKSSEIGMILYIDEFQIDAADRAVLSDAMLLSFSASSEIFVFDQRSTISYGFSVSHPNFGQHPGPFTTTTIGAFPLFEYTPGMQSLYFFKADIFEERSYQISLSGFSEKWLNISQLSPEQMNLREELDKLDINTDSRISLQSTYSFESIPLSIGGMGWLGTDEENNSGVKLSLRFKWENNPKQ